MGLDLTGAGTISDEDYETVLNRADVAMEHALSSIRKMGIKEYPAPKGAPPDLSEEGLSEKVSKMENEQLAALHAKYTAYASFIYTRTAEAKARAMLSQKSMEAVGHKLALDLFAKKTPAKEVKAKIAANGLYSDLELNYLKDKIVYDLLESRYKAYSKQIASISRIIAIRGIDVFHSDRDNHLGKTGKPSWRKQPAPLARNRPSPASPMGSSAVKKKGTAYTDDDD